jgi:tetratricopeptide (TPR) repeat protein
LFLLVAFLVLASIVTVASRRQASDREEAYRQNNVGVAHLERYDFQSAIVAFRRALQIDPSLALARLNLAIALLQAGQPDAAASDARLAVEALPQVPQAQFVVGLVARADNRADEAMAAFRRVLAIDPADVGSRIHLAQVLLGEQKYSEAVRLFEEAGQLEPFNATAAYGLGTALTRAGEREKGAAALQRFEQLRNNPAAVTYSSTYLEQGRYGEALTSTGVEPELVDQSIAPVMFADATADVLGEAPEARGIALFDADQDGDLDLALVAPGRLRLLSNDRGRLRSQTADLKVADQSLTAAVAGDYDNDGRPDLFLLSTTGGRLVRQEPNGTWRDATSTVSLPPLRPATTAAWADVDHDGDLDIVTGAPQLARNNGNGSFGDLTADARLSDAPPAIAIVPTDYDNRRDIDLLFVPSEGVPSLFGNVRDGTFRDVAEEARLWSRDVADARSAKGDRYRAVAAGDVNKDGFTDFFFARAGAVGRLATSDGAGRFTFVDGPAETLDTTAAQFIDYDNDGILDVLVLTPAGPALLRRVGAQWIDVTARALPATLAAEGDSAVALSAGDLDGDGDTDVMVRFASGRVRVWRNDGGSRQASLNVRLAPRVSNRSALGAKVDVRAGSLRQRLETSATTPPAAPANLVFGLGSRGRADVVRVLWPAGILQAETNLVSARAGAASPMATITELNRKPSSCPFLYTWNGSRFEFVTDFMGGGEMGAWAGPGVWNTPDPDEYVRIRGDQLRPRNGRYEVRVTNELEEVVFIDRLHLVAVSHPGDVDVYPNEGLRSPAERRPFAVTTVQQPQPPRRVLDHHGHDVLDRVKTLDRRFVDDFTLEAIQGYAEHHWVEIDLGVQASDARVTLLLTGWTDYAFSSDNVAAHQAGLPFRLPSLEVKNASGQWVTAIEEIGLPVGRPQTVVVDLSPLVARGVREVRIVTTLRVYWDQILVDASTPAAFTRENIEAATAILKWRGFSAAVSPDGRDPWDYDYRRVSAWAPWKLMPGRYTREGDVRTLLSAVDDRFVIGAPGDEMALSFDAADVPPTPAGWTTTFFLFVDGFSKEMNLHSGSPDQVEPLPFHAMSGYPYPASDRYPESPEHQQYRAMYNTRVIGRQLPPLEIQAPAVLRHVPQR